MRPLWLDYQRPPPGRHRSGMLLLGAGVVITAGLLMQYFSLVAEADAAQEQVSQLRRQVQQQPVAATGGPSSSPAEGEANYTAARWETLFASLEAASDDSMTLLGLQPGANEIQISGEAKNLPAAMDYVTRLQGSKAFVNVRLTQSEVVTAHPQHPVRFAVVAQWGAAAR